MSLLNAAVEGRPAGNPQCAMHAWAYNSRRASDTIARYLQKRNLVSACKFSNQTFNLNMSAPAPTKISPFRPPYRPAERPTFESGKPVCASGATPSQRTSRVQQPDGTWTSVATGAWTCGPQIGFGGFGGKVPY